ncbi:MAG: O-antigen ligase family protein [Patescibacteria group bacterium]
MNPKYFFYAFLISIPLGARVLLYQFTAGFNEYEAVFLYVSDALMLLFLIAWAKHSHILKNVRMLVGENKLLCAFLGLALISVAVAFSKPLAIYNFVRLVLLAMMALATAKLLKIGAVKFENILAVIVASSVVQSLVGIGQFIKQESLGLARLGEPVIGPNVGGAAKIIAEGGKVLRAYGTLPHPNVLAAFLVIGLLAILYFLLRPIDKTDPSYRPIRANKSITIRDGLLVIGLFIIILGLVFSFSRSAWLVGAIFIGAFLIWALFHKEYRQRAAQISVILLSILLISIFYFHSFILPRAQVSPSEPAVTQRIGYNDIAISLIKNNFPGVGIGNQVLYSVKNEVYKNAGMTQVWQWQPVHNIYLLIGAEIGILGLAAFLIFITAILVSSIKYQVLSHNSSFVIPLIMLMALLALGLFDHFLWTLQPGRLIFWLVIGIVLSQRFSGASLARK